jgi:hypothetical protein
MATQHIPAVHSVHFYDEHAALINRLSGIVTSGLEMGNSVVLVTTPEHRRQLLTLLQAAGVDVRSHEKKGSLTIRDARETMAAFMVNGSVNRNRFISSIGELLSQAKKAARNAGQGLTVFGEMVAVLWEDGNRKAAIELEGMWNDLLNDRAFHLHCAYPRWNFADGDTEQIAAICDSHSHVLGSANGMRVA